MKKYNIRKHVNIHIITFILTIFAVVLLDLLRVYSISPTAMIAFLTAYSLYIIISTIYMVSKNESNKINKK